MLQFTTICNLYNFNFKFPNISTQPLRNIMLYRFSTKKRSFTTFIYLALCGWSSTLDEQSYPLLILMNTRIKETVQESKSSRLLWWLRICLPMQRMWAQTPGQGTKSPHAATTEPLCHKERCHALQLRPTS